MKPARRAPASAWWAAGASVVVAIGVAALASALAPLTAPIVVYVGGFGVVTLASALVLGLTAFVGPSVACLVGASALSLVGAHGAVRVDAIVTGAGSLVAAELAYRSLERRVTVRTVGRLAVREGYRLAAVVLGASALSLVLLTVAPGGAGGAALAIAGAVGAAGFVIVVVREASRAEASRG